MEQASTSGYVYILVNSSFPDLVKIGRTAKDPELRARELRMTGVPTSFVVAYSVFVSDCEALEASLHSELAEFRNSSDREFFKIDAKRAIDLLISKAKSEMEVQKLELQSASNFYVFNIKPIDERNFGVRLSSRLLDERAWALFAGCLAGQDRREDWPSFFPIRSNNGHQLKNLYRVGLTESNQNDLCADFYRFMVSEEGWQMLARPELIHFQPVMNINVNELLIDIQHKSPEQILNAREQLLYADSSTIQALINEVTSISDEYRKCQEIKILQLQEASEISIIKGRI